MSWGATAYTPQIGYNNPPFGFHERIQPSDFTTCPENPYSGSENIKEAVRKIFEEQKGNPNMPPLLEHFSVNNGCNLPLQTFMIRMGLCALLAYIIYRYRC